MNQSDDPPRRRIRIHKVALPAIGVGAIALVAIWIAGLFGQSGGGGQNGNNTPAVDSVQQDNNPGSPQTLPSGPAEKVVVTIHQHDYEVDGKSESVEDIVAAAKQAVAAGITSPVQIIRVSDTREEAMLGLEKALNDATIPFSTLETPGTTQP